MTVYSKEYTNQQGNPAQIYRTEANIGMDGWVNIMKDAAEGKGEKALMDQAPTAEPLAPNGIPGFADLAAPLKALTAQITQQNAASAKEAVVDLDDEIPF